MATSHRFSLDRFEGRIAVLVDDDGRPWNVPAGLLPKGVQPGDVLTVRIERDDEATQALAAETRALQDDLKRTDSGGDLTL